MSWPNQEQNVHLIYLPHNRTSSKWEMPFSSTKLPTI